LEHKERKKRKIRLCENKKGNETVKELMWHRMQLDSEWEAFAFCFLHKRIKRKREFNE